MLASIFDASRGGSCIEVQAIRGRGGHGHGGTCSHTIYITKRTGQVIGRQSIGMRPGDTERVIAALLDALDYLADGGTHEQTEHEASLK